MITSQEINIIERAAYHEAGHAVVLWRSKRQEFQHSHIIITSRGEGLIQTLQPSHGSPTPPLTRDQRCLVALAGRAAEKIKYPELSCGELILLSSDDEAQARELILEKATGNISEDTVIAQINEFTEKASEILREDWKAVCALAERLFGLGSPNNSICLDGLEALRLMDAAIVTGGR
jgi:hypothetical protein